MAQLCCSTSGRAGSFGNTCGSRLPRGRRTPPTAADAAGTEERLQAQAVGRRSILLSGLALSVLSRAERAEAVPKPPLAVEADNETSAFISALVASSKANKQKYDKMRLDDYNKRNFKEYFQFEGGNPEAARARGLSIETQRKITQWLKDNE